MVIPRRVRGGGLPVESTQHFPSRRAKRSVLDARYPGVFGANNPYYHPEEDHPGDPLINSDDGGYSQVEDSKPVQYPTQYPYLNSYSYPGRDAYPNTDPNQHPGVNPGQHLGQNNNYNNRNSAQDRTYNGRGGKVYGSSNVNGDYNSDIGNKIDPIDEGVVKHSYEVYNSKEYADHHETHFDNYINPREPHLGTHQESWDRSRDSLETNDNAGDAEQWDNAHYSLEAFGRQFDLHLEPNLDFLSEGVVIQHLDTNRTWLSDSNDVGLHCFHRGKVAGDPSSSVVLSICDHLVSRVSRFFMVSRLWACWFLFQRLSGTLRPEQDSDTNVQTGTQRKSDRG